MAILELTEGQKQNVVDLAEAIGHLRHFIAKHSRSEREKLEYLHHVGTLINYGNDL